MDKLQKNVILDMWDEKMTIISSKQYDRNSRRIIFELTNNEQSYPITQSADITVRVEYLKPDSLPVYDACAVNSDGTVTLDITEQMDAAAGEAIGRLEITDVTDKDHPQITHSSKFKIQIESKVIDDNAVTSTYEFNALQDEIAKADAATASCIEATNNMATTYVKTADIVNNLTSTSTTVPLSARQGKILQDEIDTNTTEITTARGVFTNLDARLDSFAPKYFLTPEDYGAKGDGTTDDTTAIQDCFDDAHIKKCEVHFLSKYYLTTQPLIVHECNKLIGGNTNDEYAVGTVILNTTTDMFKLTSNTVGAHFKNICFKGGITGNNAINFMSNATSGTYALEWCVFEDCGFIWFDNVFYNISTLGCRYHNLWINHCIAWGKINGSDNTFNNIFASDLNMPTYTGTENYLELTSLSLSRFENVYFTGKSGSDTGASNILKIGQYSNNNEFIGCYFDFSNGRGVYIIGGGSPFPDAAVQGNNFTNCLFRGNGCNQTTVYPTIEIQYSQGINITGCMFMTQTRYTENASSVLYLLGQYAQNVNIYNNYYQKSYSISDTYNNAIINEPYIKTYKNINAYSSSDASTTRVGKTCISTGKITATTGSSGEITFTLNDSFTTVPHLVCTAWGHQYAIAINNITTTQATIQVMNGANWLVSSSVTFEYMAIGKKE